MEDKNQEWELVEPNVWKPEEGKEIQGVLIGTEPAGEHSSAKYYIENEDGRFFVWSSAVLADRLKHVAVGQKVRIVSEGKVKNKKNQDVNMFKVYVSRKKQEFPATDNDKTQEG